MKAREIKDWQQKQYLLGFTTVLVIFENSFKLNSPKGSCNLERIFKYHSLVMLILNYTRILTITYK